MTPVVTEVKAPPRFVPPARVDFNAEDRAWIAERLQEVLATGRLTLGKYGEEFEKNFAAFCGVKHALAVNSGTSALEIVLRSLDVKGKDVIVPTNTFFATAAAVVHAGARPVLVDADPDWFAVRPEDVEKSLTPNTAGIVVVHIGGIVSPRMFDLQALAARRGLWLVEDAAHAHGSHYKGVMGGAFGLANGFSFYPTKVMTSGEGGMITTNNDKIAEEARIYRDQGKAGFFTNSHIRMGYNWRLSEPHAIIGVRHLTRLPEMLADRRKTARIFDEELSNFKRLKPVLAPEGGESNYYKYMAILDEPPADRKELKKLLKEKYGLGLAGEVYEDPLHKQPVFEEFANGPLPVSEDLCARHICLPIYTGMTEEEAMQVVKALREVIG